MTKPKSVICLMGPTASGKTAIGVALRQKRPIDLISVDSAMVYRGMDIGTAKPESTVRFAAPHHLIDVCTLDTFYDAACFCRDARRLIDQSHARGRVPLLLGGTMMYFRALLHGLATLPPADPSVRAMLNSQAEAQGWPSLHAQLAQIDPESYQRIDANDQQRIQRALEVYQLTDKPLSYWLAQRADCPDYTTLSITLMPDNRQRLHDVIATRFAQMLEAGFIDEVAALQARYPQCVTHPAMRSVGYRQVSAYLSGHITHDQLKAQALAATRQLAKRQMTWCRHWPEHVAVACFEDDCFVKVDALIAAFLAQ